MQQSGMSRSRPKGVIAFGCLDFLVLLCQDKRTYKLQLTRIHFYLAFAFALGIAVETPQPTTGGEEL
jgi:hypothetical protein